MSRATAALCRLEEIPDRTGKGFTITRDGREVEILVVRAGDRAYGYVNCCPHYGITLEWMRDKFVDHAGEYIQCSTHGACFRFEDGYCVWGPCGGDSLEGVALVERDGLLHIKED
jgi:nitrite reductase/ring-hydroxylating ferredoxin subunit